MNNTRWRKYFCINRSSSYKNTILSAPPPLCCYALPLSFSLGQKHLKQSTQNTDDNKMVGRNVKRERRDQIHLYPPSFTSTHPNNFSLCYYLLEINPTRLIHTLIKTHAHFNTLSHVRKNYSFFFFFFKKLSQYRNISSFYFYIAFV